MQNTNTNTNTNKLQKFKKLLFTLSLGLTQTTQAAQTTQLPQTTQTSEFILNLDNVQSVKRIVCEKGLYYVIADIDDNVNDKVPLYKMVNGKATQATCNKGK